MMQGRLLLKLIYVTSQGSQLTVEALELVFKKKLKLGPYEGMRPFPKWVRPTPAMVVEEVFAFARATVGHLRGIRSQF